jgi:hypothetical protein
MVLLGRFCHHCGQKHFSDADRRLRHLVELFVAELFSLDGKFWRSLHAIFKPGFLACEYLAGRRAPYLSPVSIFLLVNVLYFLFPVLTDFDLPFTDQVPGQIALQLSAFKDATPERVARLRASGGQLHSYWSARWVRARLAARQKADPSYRIDDLAQAYDAKSADISKLLIFIHIPFLALALALLFWRRRLYFAEHFVVALVLFATVLLAVQLIFPLLSLLSVPEGFAGVLKLLLLLGFGALVASALRRIYHASIGYAGFAALAFLLALGGINASVYRAAQFVIVFALS